MKYLASFTSVGRERGAGLAALLIVLFLQGIFAESLYSGPRRLNFDFYARAAPRAWHSTPVVIVAIDETSLDHYGQWPWPRQRLARLIDKILAYHPTAVGLDILMPEPDRLSPARWLRGEDVALPPDAARSFERLPDHDVTLAHSISSGPIVLGVAGERTGQPSVIAPEPLVISHGGDPARWVPRFDSYLRSIPILDAAARGHGMLSVDQDSDGVIRRLPSISVVGSQLVPSLTLEMLRLAKGSEKVDLRLAPDGLRSIRVGDTIFPTESDGSVWLHLSPHDDQRFISAGNILNGSVTPSALEERFVIVGLTGLGLVDRPTSILGPMPGIELHAQLLENIFDGDLAVRPRWAARLEFLLTFSLGLLLVVALPGLKYRWYAPILSLPIALLAGGGFYAWQSHTWLVDGLTPAINIVVVFTGMIGGTFAEIDANRRLLRRTLEDKRVKEAKLDGELQAAQRIQLGILPQISKMTPDARFDLEAVMLPAREVGGDLYDFFKIDEDHLFIAIGDVSGKGIPASLFMAVGKSLCKSCALRGDVDISKIIAQANAEISRDNAETMFITLFAGIVDLSSGRLTFCNAGQDAPFILRRGRSPLQLSNIGGPPLCVVDEFPYPAEAYQFESGDILMLMTDGISEAVNGDGQLLGYEAPLQSLAKLPLGATAKDASQALLNAVKRFVKETPASDDMTLLTIRWLGSEMGTGS